MAADFGRRFDDLVSQAGNIESKKTRNTGQHSLEGFSIDTNEMLNWRVKCRQLLTSVCGLDSPHLSAFTKHEEPESLYITSYETFLMLKAVLFAAKEDYEGGYLNQLRSLIQADLFDDELEQAEELTQILLARKH